MNITNETFLMDEDPYDGRSFPHNCSYLNYTDYMLNDTNCGGAIFEGGELSSLHAVAYFIMQLCYLIACIVGLVGNTLVIYVIRDSLTSI